MPDLEESAAGGEEQLLFFPKFIDDPVMFSMFRQIQFEIGGDKRFSSSHPMAPHPFELFI